MTRTVARARLPQPTGIDRVERAYVDWLLGRGGRFVCTLDGRRYEVPGQAVGHLVRWLDGDADAPGLDLRSWARPQRPRPLRQAQSLVRRTGRRMPPLAPVGPGPGIYLNVGHDVLEGAWLRWLRGQGWLPVALIHDVIPLDHPAYARPQTVPRFRAKVAALGEAAGVICNSQDTLARLAVHCATLPAARAVLPLGVRVPVTGAAVGDGAGFVALGTIEPRKNHALLLDLWSEFWDEAGPDAPHLTLIGRRGWLNADVFQILDSHPMMGRIVHEAGALDDAATAAHLAAARALLFPSRAEGYGLPVAEALAQGVAVIASNLPAVREVAAGVPDLLAPDDRTAWRQAILDYAAGPDAPRAAAQRARRARWSPTTWSDHFDGLENFLETILVQAPGNR